MYVKICGITRIADLEAAFAAGASAVGFVVTDSPRQVSYAQAAELVDAASGRLETVAVLHEATQAEVERVAAAVAADRIQCEPGNGVSSVANLVPVFHASDTVLTEVTELASVHDFDRIHLEGAGRGGRGVAVSHETAREVARHCPTVLAGGLRPDNVQVAIQRVSPFGVDVSSGVETAPGIKDRNLIERFITAARAATEV